ncbi:hypothetical protein QFX18_01420 [Saccharophagus degradans]|uniref:hypothetical protein n=1 Tax=Saccharophagus degradans TaxID=86304 RepID=UPI0024780964|nr:hypothetical protein [Saccharophagus degradans]WGO98720.1 hypothetical protein QFX18_01420 [Saccharophagus degradans]
MKKVPINKDAYSASSKKSVGFEFLNDYYEDKKYRCKKCYKQDVYTAEQQKKTFEIKKAYMWQERFICNLCYQEMIEIKKELSEIEINYLKDKESVMRNKGILKRWLFLLKEYPKYWRKENTAQINFVQKAIDND